MHFEGQFSGLWTVSLNSADAPIQTRLNPHNTCSKPTAHVQMPGCWGHAAISAPPPQTSGTHDIGGGGQGPAHRAPTDVVGRPTPLSPGEGGGVAPRVLRRQLPPPPPGALGGAPANSYR